MTTPLLNTLTAGPMLRLLLAMELQWFYVEALPEWTFAVEHEASDGDLLEAQEWLW